MAETVASLVPRAGFIFDGTVLDPGRSTLEFPIDRPTAVVRVNEIFRAPPDLGQQPGAVVTVVLGEDGQVRSDEQATFFTNGWLYGETIAVVEVGRWRSSDVEARTKGPREELSMAITREDERPLAERVASAQLIVVGKVTGLARAPEERRRLITEHDPDWWEAQIEVQRALKGKPQGGGVRVGFAASTDVAWFRAPKLQPGQEGVWLLQRGEAVGREGLVVVDPLDAHAKDSAVIEQIGRLSQQRA